MMLLKSVLPIIRPTIHPYLILWQLHREK
uniref:Uncharacterized protein n=1 Tax=Rhizophora mucronata TaxID=61149 RepID=A0A2P2QXX6_RHIMU